VAIGGDGTVTAGAALDLSKANGGLLLPQVTSNPTSGDLLKRGMMIYNTTTKNTYTYDGATWVGSEITINDGGSGSGAPAPVNPVLPGSCTDYNENSWRVGNVCVYPYSIETDWAGTTGGCEIGWNVASFAELSDAFLNEYAPTYPFPDGYTPIDRGASGDGNSYFWVRDEIPLFLEGKINPNIIGRDNVGNIAAHVCFFIRHPDHPEYTPRSRGIPVIARGHLVRCTRPI
ncbi:MAG: hypothetical protein LBN93_03680, partial [Candidatus Symbiothrix sp.]|jgi:hypothetical protein|nr:hypothetical protein [Candidatus Symbiothrix sp.]